jgi:hypothetical protein
MSIYGNHEFRKPTGFEDKNDKIACHHYSKLQWDEWLKNNKDKLSFSHGGLVNPTDPFPYAKKGNKIFIWENK